MPEKEYRYTTKRVISLWSVPGWLTAFMVFLILSGHDTIASVKWPEKIAWLLFFIFAVGPFSFLFFNHLRLAKDTRLIFRDNTLQVEQAGETYTVHFSDMEEIVEYSAWKLPWSSIMKWQIKTPGRRIVISSLTISEPAMDHFFWNKMKHKITLLPVINEIRRKIRSNYF